MNKIFNKKLLLDKELENVVGGGRPELVAVQIGGGPFETYSPFDAPFDRAIAATHGCVDTDRCIDTSRCPVVL